MEEEAASTISSKEEGERDKERIVRRERTREVLLSSCAAAEETIWVQDKKGREKESNRIEETSLSIGDRLTSPSKDFLLEEKKKGREMHSKKEEASLSKPDRLTSLSEDLLLEILRSLDGPTVARTGAVSRRLRSLSKMDSLWNFLNITEFSSLSLLHQHHLRRLNPSLSLSDGLRFYIAAKEADRRCREELLSLEAERRERDERLERAKKGRVLRCWNKRTLDAFVGFSACLSLSAMVILFPVLLCLKLDGDVSLSWFMVFSPFHSVLLMPLAFAAVKGAVAIYLLLFARPSSAGGLSTSDRERERNGRRERFFSSSQLFRIFFWNREFPIEIVFMAVVCGLVDIFPLLLSMYLDGLLSSLCVTCIPLWTYMGLAMHLLSHLSFVSLQQQMKVVAPALSLLLSSALLVYKMDMEDHSLPWWVVFSPLSSVLLLYLSKVARAFRHMLSAVFEGESREGRSRESRPAEARERDPLVLLKKRGKHVLALACALLPPLIVLSLLLLRLALGIPIPYICSLAIFMGWLILAPLSVASLSRSSYTHPLPAPRSEVPPISSSAHRRGGDERGGQRIGLAYLIH